MSIKEISKITGLTIKDLEKIKYNNKGNRKEK